jgi:DNA-3-methyladenine glycosylase
VHSTRGGVLVSGRIVETEAYPPGDPSGHAFRGKTASNGSLFLERGFAYVYFCYGSSFMMNVSSEHAGTGAGVLIRALEPLDGIGLMRPRRGGAPLRDLTRGRGAPLSRWPSTGAATASTSADGAVASAPGAAGV